MKTEQKIKQILLVLQEKWCPNLAHAISVERERLKLSPAKPRLPYTCNLGSLSVIHRQILQLTIICNRKEEQQNGSYRKSYFSCSSDSPNAMRLGRSAWVLLTGRIIS